jgi:hypothetical protein
MMRSLIAALLLTLAFAPLGCKHRKVQTQATVEDAPPELASTLHMGDPKVADQLVSGFHQIEAKAWRWTAREFAVVLRPPAGSAQLGAALQVNLTVPPVVIEKLTKITLSPSIRGNTLTPETYTKAGDYVYQADVPANLLKAGAVRVDFQLDKAIPASPADLRELGIVVTSMRLALK